MTVELMRLEGRLSLLIKEVAARMAACEQQQEQLVQQLAVVEERLRVVLANNELQNANVSQNPAFESDESDGSV